ncbi:serine hydrolase domain-containing protein [Acetatifactor aquisgranensis]|uniref:serine hydrolase domain-containing protein n=1 Tax=Acetatifactor aquisgranensis TaxID=2941233 RepID=UPI00203C61FF|nr:serine hydrolase [Acetatifactor aquisgranensis]MCI9574556.1 serine hydrolase [Lachnospiraceae bacterium]
MKQEQITSLENKIKKEYGNITGIIVLKDNNAAYESYFNQCSENDPIHIFSVTKSIISMLFGIALDKGCIKNLDEKVIDFFPNYQTRKREKTIQHVTIRNLLTMTAPYKYRFNPYPKYFSSDDWVISSLDLLGGNGKIGNFKYAPVIGIDILSGILVNATGKSVLEFAQDNLFSPLGISVDKNIYFQSKEEQLDFYQSKGANGWVADPKGTNTAGWGLSLTTMDMAKLGQLYLNEGHWNGRQVISDQWIFESTQVQSVWKARHLKYGYLWWVIDEAEHSYAALGDGGNAIYVNVKDKIVVAISSLFVPRVKDRIDFIKREIEPLFILCTG